ncbi:XdhC family protein [Aureivirga marina]|uniref:XdhC family protein n=1 Tax=Aureivirga marina TaxID=1182451 RepID=UPI0018C929FF|nr:XdhC/CoxI family protein [Aureivirga marina]
MSIWKEISQQLNQKKRLYLLTVIANEGSSPGKKGFKMFVNDSGDLFGSIGGGIMEFDLIEEAKRNLKNGIQKNYLKEQIHQKNVEKSSGMICSGKQTIMFHFLNQSFLPTIEKIIHSKSETIYWNLNSISLQKSGDIFYQEKVIQKSELHIIGGGHISLALSEFASKLDFKITVYDNRTKLNTLESNIFADVKKVINYEDISSFIQHKEEAYIVIMTNKFTDDFIVLKNLLEFQFKYIGILGSKAKLTNMWNSYKKQGISEDKLQQVHAPIGLSIKSETPHEIAISILSEIILVKNKT